MKQPHLHMPKNIATFQQIIEWDEDTLSDQQKQQIGDYLTIKKSVRHKWGERDQKRFLKAKKILATDSETITNVEIEKQKVVA